jgi:hypothetical protein
MGIVSCELVRRGAGRLIPPGRGVRSIVPASGSGGASGLRMTIGGGGMPPGTWFRSGVAGEAWADEDDGPADGRGFGGGGGGADDEGLLSFLDELESWELFRSWGEVSVYTTARPATNQVQVFEALHRSLQLEGEKESGRLPRHSHQ